MSATTTPLSVAGLDAGLLNTRVSVELPPSAIAVGLKFLVMVGGPSTLAVAAELEVPNWV